MTLKQAHLLSEPHIIIYFNITMYHITIYCYQKCQTGKTLEEDPKSGKFCKLVLQLRLLPTGGATVLQSLGGWTINSEVEASISPPGVGLQYRSHFTADVIN